MDAPRAPLGAGLLRGTGRLRGEEESESGKRGAGLTEPRPSGLTEGRLMKYSFWEVIKIFGWELNAVDGEKSCSGKNCRIVLKICTGRNRLY